LEVWNDTLQEVTANGWDNTRMLISKVEVTDPLLVKIIRWIDYKRDNTTANFTAITRFISDNPNWPNLAVLQRQAERLMPESLPPSKVIAWFRYNPPVSISGLIRHAEALQTLGQRREAEKLVREHWLDQHLSIKDDQDLVLERLGTMLSPSDHEARLDALLWAERNSEATMMLPLVSPNYRILAETRLHLVQHVIQRESEIKVALTAVPESLRNDEGLLFAQLRWCRRADMINDTVELLARQPDTARYVNYWWKERQLVARRLLAKNSPEAAYAIARLPNSTGASRETRSQSEWLRGWISLRFLNQPARALEHFQQLYQAGNAPITLARGAYWIARALAAQGDQRQAHHWAGVAASYGTTFYGQLAAGQLDSLPFLTVIEDPKPTPDQQNADSSELVKAAVLLYGVGDTNHAGLFLRHLVQNAHNSVQASTLGHLANTIGQPYYGIQAAKHICTSGTVLLEAGWPLLPLSMTSLEPEPALLLAIIRRESEFLPTVISPVGAQGLMQLMPATATIVASELGLANNIDILTTDPNYNIRLGSAYLEHMLTRFAGSYILAIAAYNAGPTRVDQWISQLGDPRTLGVDVIDWIESIPISETQNYVQRVLEDLQVYRLRLGQPPVLHALEHDLTR
jgi:soluble lytic murein transglycosylase